jgi:lysophospholipid acyltransferase (LPLAT)-like uncharacterized protein
VGAIDQRDEQSGGPPAARVDRSHRKRRHQRVKRARRRLGKLVMHAGAPLLLRALSTTWRPRIEGEANLASARGVGGGHFMALWHGSMLVPLPYYRNRNWHVLVSPSQDGDISEALLQRFGYQVIRGSSSRGGASALRAMLAVLGQGAVIAITPDGPRGPAHSVNPGLAWMARATGHAIVPCGYVCDRAWHAASWDRFTFPKPFARLAFVYGEPIRIERAASTSDMNAATIELRERMLAAERRGFELLGVEPGR